MKNDERRPRSPRESLEVFLPGGLAVLRIAVEELLSSGWSELFRRRAEEIAAALEGSLRCFKRDDLASLSRSIVCLLELDYRQANDLGPALPEKLNELLGRLEVLLDSDQDTQTG